MLSLQLHCWRQIDHELFDFCLTPSPCTSMWLEAPIMELGHSFYYCKSGFPCLLWELCVVQHTCPQNL